MNLSAHLLDLLDGSHQDLFLQEMTQTHTGTCTTQGLAIVSSLSACYAILMHMACILLYHIHLSYLVLSSAILQASIENGIVLMTKSQQMVLHPICANEY